MHPHRVYGSVITHRGWGQGPQVLKQAKRHSPFCLEMTGGHYHKESLPRCSFPLARSKIRHSRVRGQLHKVWGLSSGQFVLTDGRPPLCGTVFVRLPPPLQGRLDCILILGHSYMVAQTDRGHEPHRHYTLWTRSHLYMCVNGTRRSVIMIIDISSERRFSSDFDSHAYTDTHTYIHLCTHSCSQR